MIQKKQMVESKRHKHSVQGTIGTLVHLVKINSTLLISVLVPLGSISVSCSCTLITKIS